MKEILIVPNPILREVSETVSVFDSRLAELETELFAVLDHLNVTSHTALGLAAPQIGESAQIFVIDSGALRFSIVNPVILRAKKSRLVREGCLSMPDKVFVVKRPKIIKIRGVHINGESFTIKARDLDAQIICHEVDHLHGILIDERSRLDE